MAFDLKTYQREYGQANRERLAAYRAEWRRKNAEKIKADRANHYRENRDTILAEQAAARAANPGAEAARQSARRRANPERIREQDRASKRRNADAVRARMADYRRRARAANPLTAMKDRLRARMGLAFRQGGYTKRSSLVEVLGCDYPTLIAHIECQFAPGMSWANRGEWHLDHRTPLASAESESELVRLCHYTNLQPMWASENMAKGARQS